MVDVLDKGSAWIRSWPGSQVPVSDLGCGQQGHGKAHVSAWLAHKIHTFFLTPDGCPKVNSALDREYDGKTVILREEASSFLRL